MDKSKRNKLMKQNNSQHRMPKVTTKTTRRKTTVADLLTRDNVNDILNDLEEMRPNIGDLIVIYVDKRDKRFCYQVTEDTLVSTATWLLESTKLEIINSEDEE